MQERESCCDCLCRKRLPGCMHAAGELEFVSATIHVTATLTLAQYGCWL